MIYSEAINGIDSENWKAAIQEEKDSLMKNKTWIEGDSDQINDKRILNARWIFKIKEDGCHTAQLVVRGFEQEKGIDYDETYSSVLHSNVFRLLMTLSIQKDYYILKFDIKTTFLYGHLDEEITS